MIYLENWSVVYSKYNPYFAPEIMSASLQGVAYGHPRYEDGQLIRSSSIQSIEGRIIKTLKSVYFLCKVDPAYAAWLGKLIDPENPLG